MIGRARTAPLALPVQLASPYLVDLAAPGMNGLALYLAAAGARVSGSVPDRADPDLVRELEGAGVRVVARPVPENVGVGHSSAVWSGAVAGPQPELDHARQLGLPVLGHAQALALAVDAAPRGVVVAGSHSTQTAAAMLPAALGHLGSGWILNAAPSRQLAGHAGGGDLLVADLGPDATTHEAPPGFARCTSALALVTAACANPPHHRDRNAALDVLEDLTRVSNTVVLAIGDSGMRLLAQRLTDRPGPRVVTAGEAYDADIRLMRHLWSGTHSHITVRDFDGAFHTITTTMPGRHHALATTAAFAAALALGANPAEVAGGISAHFHGLDGYLTTVGTQRHTTVLASRARHPAEIAADLTAARLLTDGTLTAILEPDGHTRTTGLARELGDALALADRVVLLPVSSPLSTVAVVDPLVAVADATSAAGVPSEQIIAWRPGPCAPSLEATCTGGSGPGDLIVVIGTGTTARGLGPRLLHHIAAPTTPVPADL